MTLEKLLIFGFGLAVAIAITVTAANMAQDRKDDIGVDDTTGYKKKVADTVAKMK